MILGNAYRGRDIHCWMPPAQIPAGVIHAPGSHLGWLTTNPTSSFAYTIKPLGHAFPARCPARVLLSRVPLGPLPWLHRLRPQSPRFVRRLQRYYDEVSLLLPVLHRLRLLAFPIRTAPKQLKRSSKRSPGSRAKSVPTCQGLRPRRAEQSLALTRLPILLSTTLTASAP